MGKKRLSMRVSIIWNSVGSIFYLGCQWILTVLIVRIAGVDTAGILSLAMSVCNIWYCLAVYGMRNFQVSDTLNKYSNGTYILSRFITCLLAFVGCLVYIFIIPYNSLQRICIVLYLLFKFTEALFDVYAGIFQKEWRLDYVGKSLFIRGVLSIFSFVLFLILTRNIVFALACMAVTCIFSIFMYDILHAKKIADISLDRDMEKVKSLLVECFPLVIYTLLSSSIGTIPRLVMERVLGNYHIGIYGSVATPTLIIQMAATYVFNPFVTVFAERYNRKEKQGFLKAFLNCTFALMGISILGIIGGKIFGLWGLKILYGQEVSKYVDLLIPLIICTILTAFSWLLCGVLTAIREFKGLVIGNIAAVFVAALLSYPLEKYYGMQGANMTLASAVIVEIILLFCFMLYNMKKQFK